MITCMGLVTELVIFLQFTNVRNQHFSVKYFCFIKILNIIDESHSSGTIHIAAPILVSYYGCKNSVTGCSLKLKPGFFLSNEPGYYKEGDFGIRLENILEVIPASKLVDLNISLPILPIFCTL